MDISQNNNAQIYDLSNLTIMLVEDSPHMQSLITSMLKAFGVGDIVVCDGGTEARELLTIMQARTKSRHINSVDIILTDWLMPNGSGHELLKWIRSNENESIKFLPAIVISGYTTEKVTNLARDCGASETLVKPVAGKTLAARICSVIDTPRPFIQTEDFFGPDRRRQDESINHEDRRHPDAASIAGESS